MTWRRAVEDVGVEDVFYQAVAVADELVKILFGAPAGTLMLLPLSFCRSDPANGGGNIRPFHSGLPSLAACFGNHAIKIAHGGHLDGLEDDVVFAHDVVHWLLF